MSTDTVTMKRSTANDTSEANSAVRFNDFVSIPPKFHEREKYLTAKYPQEQMQLIRKRLKVEFWLDDQLRSLYHVKDDDDYEHCPADLIDSLLDIDGEAERQTFLQNKFIDIQQPPSTLKNFIHQLLHHVRML